MVNVLFASYDRKGFCRGLSATIPYEPFSEHEPDYSSCDQVQFSGASSHGIPSLSASRLKLPAPRHARASWQVNN
jgi:hypothetical protein